MATVIGKTSVRIDELLSDVVVDVSIVNGNLIVENHAGFVANKGPVGGGGGGSNYLYESNVVNPNSIWTFTHDLGTKGLSVTTWDNVGNELFGDVTFPTINSVRVQFFNPQSGILKIWK